MPVVDTPEKLFAALGKSPFATDPLADLARQGYTLTPELNQQLQSALKGRTLPLAAARPAAANPKRVLTFQQAPRIAPLTQPAPGNYDLLAGLTLTAADEAVAGVYASGTIPHLFQLDQLLSATELTALEGFFKASGGRLTRLHVTAAPTLAATTDGTPVVALRIPIQLDWTQTTVTSAGPFQKLITTGTGALTLTMSLVTNVVVRPDLSSSTMSISAQLDTEVTSAADSPRLTLNPNSPVQLISPAPPNQVDGTAVIIQNALAQQLGGSLTVSVSPVFNLPTGALALTHADVISKSGMLLAGLQILGGATGATDPAQLSNMLPSDGSNVFLQITSSAVNAVMQNALNTGQLTVLARQQQSNAVADSASASFQNNQFVAQVHLRLVDECPLNVDLVVILTRTVSIKLNGGSIEIDESDDHSIADAHNIWCLLSTLGVGALVLLIGSIFGGFGFLIAAALDVAAGTYATVKLIKGLEGKTSSDLLNLTQPIPGSDLLPTLNTGFYGISNGAMLIAATAGTTPDTINTIIYVRFVVPAGGIVATAGKPLVGVTVALMDQDVPPPAADDASTQVPTSTSSGTGKKQVTVDYKFVPPTADQQLAVGKTDANGVVRFALLVDQLATTAGTVEKTTRAYDPDALRFVTTTARAAVPEAKPDLYFRVTMPDGTTVDTRQLPGGLMVNFISSRVGTLANPLTFNLGGGTVVGNRQATSA